MNTNNTGLVLEGGGMRGVYSSGVLRFLMEKEIYLPYVIGVSMGACNAANYIAKQPERNKIVNIKYVNDRRYLSYFRLITRGELFGMNFIFNTIPNSLELFDYETFYKNPARCVTTVTDCESGKAAYFEKDDLGEDYMLLLQASSSLPFIAYTVPYRGRVYMDGGMSDSIPLRKSMSDGNRRNVLILTQPRGYRKKPEPLAKLARYRYPRLKGIRSALDTRHRKYNETLDFIDAEEKKGDIFIIRPDSTLSVSRVERDQKKLYDLYDKGYNDAESKYSDLLQFLR